MKLYREVKASERLPKVHAEFMTDEGWVLYMNDFNETWGYESDLRGCWIDVDVKWWLEPIEITEGEIYEILVNEIMGCDGPEKRVAAKAILSKLK